MRKRLLFWINVFMSHFILACYLQKKIDDDFYAIIDVPNNPKKMFLNQKIVNFQKVWYFHDHIKRIKIKPDLEYLANFEKKYRINLWKLAINERHFYRFNRFYRFSYDEILQFLEQECRLFEQIIGEIKPDYFLTYDPPFHHQKLIQDMCKAIGIKVLCLYFARIGGKSVIADDGGTLNLPQDLDSIELHEGKEITERVNFNQTENYSSYSLLTKDYKNARIPSASNKLKALIDYILVSDSANTQTNFTYYGRAKLKVILDALSMTIKRKSRSRYLENNSKKTVDLDVPYVYFPMNVDEELSMLHYSPFFTDQIEVIKHVAKSIPVDYQLYVKDHPFQEFRAWRDIHEYQEIIDLPNVTLIHPSYPSKELIKHSKLVVTIRGTASLDAAYENKPSIVFGDVPFSIIPSVHKVNSLNELPKLIRTCLSTPVNPSYIQKYIKLVEGRSVDFSMMDFEVKRNHYFYSNNILSDINISEESVKQFLKENEKYFEILTNAHLEIIKS